jgi:hypothetical protein
MPAEFRFECKYCNEPIFAPYDMGGKKARCPHCKNTVTVPLKEAQQTEQAEAQKKATRMVHQQTKGGAPAGKTPAHEAKPPAVARKDANKRPVQSRHKWDGLKGLLKFAILLAIAYAAFKGYEYYQQQAKKDFATLMREYADGNSANKVLIEQRVNDHEMETLSDYSDHSKEEVRALVAHCLSEVKSKKTYELLTRLIRDKDDSVRMAAAKSLTSVRTRQCVEFLIGRLEHEKNDEVRGAIGYSLRQLTGQSPPTGKQDFWQLWWKQEGCSSFKIKD